jgi:tetratricopeptide (TPR) repeat protein
MTASRLAILLGLVSAVHAQSTPPSNAAQPDYSQQASVVELMSTRVSFDKDGGRTREQVTRVKVNTDAGVKAWGLLNLPYQSATETVEVVYVRVHRPDNSTVVTPEDNFQDLDAEITRSAPFYSDLREKHVAVKGLAKGDVLEYQVRWHPTKPLIPGQFWFDYNFEHEGIVLDERLEIRAPADRPAKFKGPQATQSVTTDGNVRVYSWTYSKLDDTKDAESDKKKEDAAIGRLPAPDVQFSSFQNWDEVGRWYWNLQKERIEPSPAVRAKATELTKGLTDDAAKIQALYSFVSTQYRYIGIAFGIGRYQPHAADDVLSNNYGDCKDKHTLLAALLDAAGMTLHPALISAERKLDPDVPSPGQFDHVIGYLPHGKTAIWLDTTPEVAPVGYLVVLLRDKQALVMMSDGSAKLMTTPVDPPLANQATFKIEGTLHEDGSLDAHVDDSTRGDPEVTFRGAFRRIPQPQWKELVQGISYGLGYSGTVSDVDASAPDALSQPFHFSYHYNRKDYPDWSNRQLTVPGLPFYMPEVKDDRKSPVWFGSAIEAVSDSKIELPKGYKPQIPSDVDLVYDFAEYHATYKADQGVLTCRRRLITKMSEIPVAELDDYRSFIKNMRNDVDRYVQTASTNVPAEAFATAAGVPAFFGQLRNLPDSTLPEANRLEADARTSMLPSAFKLAVEADPKFTRAWVELATSCWARRDNDAGLDALRKAIDSAPKSLAVREMYAFMLTTLGRKEAGAQAWREALQIAPDDAGANTALAGLLMEEERFADAIPYLENAAKTDPSTAAQVRLGTAYLHAGQSERGSAVLESILDKNANSVAFNDVAYELAEANTSLPKALEYAQRAVDEQERRSHDVKLATLLKEDLDCTVKIASFWDTLGWVEFRLGHLDRAERYLNAAWLLSQMAVVGDHLGQVYEQEKQTEKAIHMYRLAAATPEGRVAAGDKPRKHLEHLGIKVPTTPLLIASGDRSGDELSSLRTVTLKNLPPTNATDGATAEFFLLFDPSGKVEEASFISGSNSLRAATDSLTEAKYEVAYPEGSSARIVRRGILMCSKISGCQLVLYTPSSVDAVN